MTGSLQVHLVNKIIVFFFAFFLNQHCDCHMVNVFDFYQSYLLVLKHRPPVNEGHPRHIVHGIVDLLVEGAVFEPALVEVADAEHKKLPVQQLALA